MATCYLKHEYRNLKYFFLAVKFLGKNCIFGTGVIKKAPCENRRRIRRCAIMHMRKLYLLFAPPGAG